MAKMKYDPDIHHRRSIRMQHYDYSQAGAYFVTICTQYRACMFGYIRNGEMKLNDAGRMVTKWYHELGNKFPDIKNDEFICMPNHVHFIVINVGAVGADLRVCPYGLNKPREHRGQSDEHRGQSDEHPGQSDEHPGQSDEHAGSPLHRVVQWFKTMTTNEYIRGVKQNGWPPFPGKLWQRNYYEHIIRGDDALNKIRQYIIHNPFKWKNDENYNC